MKQITLSLLLSLFVGSTALAATVALPMGPDFMVNTHSFSGQYEPEVAMAADGSFASTWYSTGMVGDFDYDVAVRLFHADGSPKGPDFIANAYTDWTQMEPAIDMAPDGTFVVTWYGDGPNDQEGVWSRAFDANGNPLSGDVLLHSGRARYPQVGIADNGDYVVSWCANLEWKAQRVSADGTLGSLTHLFPNDPGCGWWQRMDVGPDGSFAVVDDWAMAFYDANDNPVLPELWLPTHALGRTLVGIQADGSVQLVWKESGGWGGRAYDANGVQIHGDYVLHTSPNAVWEPHMSVDGDGNFAMAWWERDSINRMEFMLTARWAADGTVLDAPFLTQSAVYDWSFWPAVALTPDQMVVVWNSEYDDGDIFGRLFVFDDPFFSNTGSSIEDFIGGGQISQEQFGSTLVTLLTHAQNLAETNPQAAIAQLNAMIAQIQAQAGRKITEEAAAELIAAIQAYIDSLQA